MSNLALSFFLLTAHAAMSKNLAYEKPSEPAFLARMRAQVAGDPEAARQQPRHAVYQAHRASTRRDRTEDEPTVVDEQGNTLSRAEYEEIQADPRNRLEGDQPDVDKILRGDSKSGPALEDAGGKRPMLGKKRKAAKVIGSADDESKASTDAKAVKRSSDDAPKKSTAQAKQVKKKPKSKSTLSFDNDDDG